jgi:lamin tail-like protein
MSIHRAGRVIIGEERVMRRILVAIMVLGFVLPSPAFAAIRLWNISYDPRGYDSGSNKHINKEYFVIKNTYSRTKNLGGWYVTDRSGKRWTFPAGYKLREGEIVRVHTGKGTSDHNDRYWGWSRYLWDNAGDRATLYNSAGKRVHWCQYGSKATSPYKC